MDKVYVLVEDYVFDFEREIQTTLYSTKEKAQKAMADTIAHEKESSWLAKYLDEEGNFDEDIAVEEGKDSIDIYPDGRASEFETHIYIREEKVY